MTQDTDTITSAESGAANSIRDPGDRKDVIGSLLKFVAVVIAAGFLASAALDRVHGENGYFQYPEEVSAKFPPMGQPIPAEILELNERTLLGLDYKNTALSFMLIGICLSVAVGVAGGLSGRSASGLMKGLVVGLFAGAILGVASGLAAVGVGTNLPTLLTVDEMLLMMMSHATGWLIIGLAVGLTMTVSCSDDLRKSAMTGAICGGLLSGLLYLPIAGILFAGDRSDRYVPDGNGNRLFWISLTGTLIVAFVAMLRPRVGKRHEPSPAE